MIKSLLWKEWCEQRWRLAFGCVMMTAFVAVGLKTRIVPDEGIIVMSLGIGAFLLPILIEMGLIAAERADGSLTALLVLPTRTRAVLAAKMCMAAVALAAPFVATATISCLMAGGREVDMWEIVLGSPWDDWALVIFPFGFFQVVDRFDRVLLLAVGGVQAAIAVALLVMANGRLSTFGPRPS